MSGAGAETAARVCTGEVYGAALRGPEAQRRHPVTGEPRDFVR